MEVHIGAYCGPGRDGITSTHVSPLELSHMPQRAGKGARKKCRRGTQGSSWLSSHPGQAPAVAVILGRVLGTAHVPASLLTSASSLTFSSYFPPIPALPGGASPLWSPCGWRKVNCLAVEELPRDSVTKDVVGRGFGRGAFQKERAQGTCFL